MRIGGAVRFNVANKGGSNHVVIMIQIHLSLVQSDGCNSCGTVNIQQGAMKTNLLGINVTLALT